MTSITSLLDQIAANPAAWVVARQQQNYDGFLNLLLSLNYPSIHPSQLHGWRERACAAWALQDELLPGNCAGGIQDGEIISTIGALPICEKLLYVHSGAMQRSLRAAATLYAATMCTVDRMTLSPEAEYWMGSYRYGSRFVTTWQRPTSFTIPEQIELEELRVYPLLAGPLVAKPAFQLIPLREGELELPDNDLLTFARMIEKPPSVFTHLYEVHAYSIVEHEKHIGVCITLDMPDEFTAMNTFRWAFILPIADVDIGVDAINTLRACSPLQDRVLRILTSRRLNIEGWSPVGSRLVPSFIALTPRSQMSFLRESLREVFGYLLQKYPEREIAALQPA